MSKRGLVSPTTVSRPACVLGFCVTNRYAGAALVVHGEPVVLESHRLASAPRRATAGRLAAWVNARLARYRDAVVAFVPTDEDGARAVEAADVLRSALQARRRTAVDVGNNEIAQTLGLTHATRVAVCEALASRHPVVAARVVRSRRCRTESERYWEIAILAAAAALVVFETLS